MTSPNSFIAAMRKHGMKGIEASADANTLKGHLNTGNLALNWIISGKFTGGWPLGHVSEVYGDPSTGKSFLIGRAVAESQKFSNSVALLDDTENAFNNVWASTGLGIDINRLAYQKPPSHTVEDHYRLVKAFIDAAKDVKISDPSILALDSLALLSTEQEIEQEMEKENMNRAKKIKQHLRLTATLVSTLPAAYLVTNHAIANIGSMWEPVTTGGGSGMKFQSTVRVQLRTVNFMKDDEKHILGVKINPLVVKNRLAPPFRQCSMIIPFYEPINSASGLIDLLINLHVLSVEGRSLTLRGEKTGIQAHASSFWKQDRGGEELLAKYPTLLEELENDKTLGVPKRGTEMAEEGAEA